MMGSAFFKYNSEKFPIKCPLIQNEHTTQSTAWFLEQAEAFEVFFYFYYILKLVCRLMTILNPLH